MALVPPRGLVWSAGGESRIKAFRIGATGQGACQFTLESAQADLLGVLGGRVLSALDDGSVEYWDIARWVQSAMDQYTGSVSKQPGRTGWPVWPGRPLWQHTWGVMLFVAGTRLVAAGA